MDHATRAAITVRLIPVERCPDLCPCWQALEAQADVTPFSAWPWVSTWLDHLPKAMRPTVFRADDEQGIVALGLLIETHERGLRRLLGERVLHLQETGDPEIDRLTIDYGGLLVRRGSERSAYRALFDALKSSQARCRNLRISASTHARHIVAALPAEMSAFRSHSSPAYVVNLERIKTSGGSYLASLGKSTRSGLRRTRRAYESLGEIRVETASEVGQALDYFDELSVLHETYWQSKGRKGSFGSSFFATFHRDLISRHVSSGLTQLSRVSAGNTLVGYLYNLVWNRRVYVYNSGLNYGALEPRHDRPGYLAHLVTIEKYIAERMKSYDFLAGDAMYKRMLSSHVQPMHWVVVKPHGSRLSLERALARWGLRAKLSPLRDCQGSGWQVRALR